MTTVELAIDPFRGSFFFWRESGVRVVVKLKTQKVSLFSGAFYGFCFRIFAAILSFVVTSALTLGAYYLLNSLLLRWSFEIKLFGILPIVWPISLCFLLNITLLVISILRTITELLTELWRSSNAELQGTHQSTASI